MTPCLPAAKSRLPSPSYKNGGLLEFNVPLLEHNPLRVQTTMMDPPCHPFRTSEKWGTYANEHEALTTAFALNNKVFVSDPGASCQFLACTKQ